MVTGPTSDYTETYYFQDTAKYGLVEKQITKDAGGNIYSYSYSTYTDQALSSTEYGYGLSPPRAGVGPDVVVYAPRLTEQNTYIVDGTTTTDSGTQPGGTDWKRSRVTYTYDDYGNIIETFDYGLYDGDETGELDSKAVYTEYINDTNTWMFKAKRIYTKDWSSYGQFLQSGDTRIYYDNQAYGVLGAAGRPTKTEVFYDADNFITSQISYDTYGNAESTTDGTVDGKIVV